MRKPDLKEACEIKACVLATFMCIVVDEHFKQKAAEQSGDAPDDFNERVYHWNDQGESEDESNLKDQELWERYHWQSKIADEEPIDLPRYRNLKNYILEKFIKPQGMLKQIPPIRFKFHLHFDCKQFDCLWGNFFQHEKAKIISMTTILFQH